MPKMKTHKGLKKRFKLSAKGKLLHRSAGTSHLLSHKSSKRKRKLRKASVVHAVEQKRLRDLMGK